MSRYRVQVWLGTWTVEVDADDADAAIETAVDAWISDPADLIAAGTFEVVPLDTSEVPA